ncbi:20213_t:CDS:1, partial [Cetraspora pellucida]
MERNIRRNEKNGYSSDELLTQVDTQMNINKNLAKDSKDNISKLKKNIRNFSLLIIVNEDKKVWISQ